MPLTNAILREVMEPFDFANPPTDPVELAKTLVHEMVEGKGIGLAANQIGLPYRAFAMKGDPFIVMFNPKIVFESDEQELFPEGCLSFPGLLVEIKRPKSIRVRFTMPNGKTETKTFDGLSARIIQHEIDHLNGKIFYERANKYHLDKARRKQKKFSKK